VLETVNGRPRSAVKPAAANRVDSTALAVNSCADLVGFVRSYTGLVRD